LGSAATVEKLEGVAEEMVVKELKKINKQLVKFVNLKRQNNLMADDVGITLRVTSIALPPTTQPGAHVIRAREEAEPRRGVRT
jgi:hypothetical protein